MATNYVGYQNNVKQLDHTDTSGLDIVVTGLTKYLGGKVLYENFDLQIASAKITCIFGPNGCGKSTLLNMVAGLLQPDAGQMKFGGKPHSQVQIGYVFQNYRDALFPWLKASANIGYPTAHHLQITRCWSLTKPPMSLNHA